MDFCDILMIIKTSIIKTSVCHNSNATDPEADQKLEIHLSYWKKTS